MLKLSVVMIAKNEEEILPLSLASVKWADEVVVVDSGSTDRTVEIAKDAGARVFLREFDNFSSQYNWAMEQAAGPWILILDADEVVDDRLRAGIEDILRGEPAHEVYDVRIDSLFLGKDMRSWKNDTKKRLFRKGALRYEGLVHSVVDLGGRVPGKTPGRLIHHTIRSIPRFLEKQRHYAVLWAEDEFRKGRVHPGIAKAIGSSLWRFVHDYVIRGAYRDGTYGVLMSVFSMQYTFGKYIHLWELQRLERENKAKAKE